MSGHAGSAAGIAIRGFDEVAAFRAHTEPWLMQREAEHNLLLGLLPKLMSDDHGYQPPIYLASVEVDAAVAGCAFRTPPYKLGLTRLPESGIEGLVDHVAASYTTLPAVMGPEREATRFAELWAERRGCAWAVGGRQRIHSLSQVIAPRRTPGGSLRPATEDDLPMLVEWIGAFARETGTLAEDVCAKARELTREQAIQLWQDGEPRSMVAAAGWTPRGARVGYVYTPEGFRGRGYAMSAVASFSEQLLRSGRRFCFLYTDLANPTANSIYARIGYRPVCDVVDVDLARGGRDPG